MLLVLKSKTAIVQFSKLIGIEFVYLTGKHEFTCILPPIMNIGAILTSIEEIHTHLGGTVFQKTINQPVITTNGNTLV